MGSKESEFSWDYVSEGAEAESLPNLIIGYSYTWENQAKGRLPYHLVKSCSAYKRQGASHSSELAWLTRIVDRWYVDY